MLTWAKTAHNGQVEGMGLIPELSDLLGLVGASLSCLHLGGQLVEIGKRDIWSASGVHVSALMWFTVCWLLTSCLLPNPPSTLPPCWWHCRGSCWPEKYFSHAEQHSSRPPLACWSKAHGQGCCVSQGLGTTSLLSMQESGCSFVTGGLGAIGSLVGQWTAQHMTPDVRLAGRSGHYRLPLDVDKSKSALLSLPDPSSSTVFCAVRCDAGSQSECSSALSWPVLDVPLSQVMARWWLAI